MRIYEVPAEMKKDERGFSIVELLIVCVVIGVIASLAVPHLQKGIRASENGNMYATLKTISSAEVDFYQKNGRFGRLAEVNNILSNSLGTSSPPDIVHGKFVVSMVPATPTDVELKDTFVITATRNVAGEGVIYVYKVTGSGIDPIFP